MGRPPPARPTSDDHRAVVVVLTRRGRTLWREMNVTYRRAVQAHVSSQLADDDVGDLRRILARSPVVAVERDVDPATLRHGSCSSPVSGRRSPPSPADSLVDAAEIP